MSSARVLLHLELPSGEARAALGAYAYRRGFRGFVVDGPLPDAPIPADVRYFRRAGNQLIAVGTTEASYPIVRIQSVVDLRRAIDLTPSGGVLVVEWAEDRVIPLENLVAVRGDRFQVWTVARSIGDVSASLGALEHGADRVIVPVRSVEEVDAVERALESVGSASLAWSLVPVKGIHSAGPGDRVIVDTTSLLGEEEGLLVGSAAAFLFHVRSEAVGSRFSRPRPFRVNAGSAHSYVLLADGSTRYLAELEAGDRLLACRTEGTSRTVRVGRLKIERRPLVLVRASVEGRSRTVFLQEAETVRLSSEDGPVSTSEPPPSFRTWGVSLAPGRHLGMAVQESVEER